MFEDYLSLLSEDLFEEIPVTAEEFVTNKYYIDIPPLSEYQLKMVKAMTQIYRKETLIELFGEEEGTERWRQTFNEVIYQLGKGSGKDFVSTVAVTYLVYLLLCLRDPAKYYGKPTGDNIDILNIAINAEQAKNVFFKGLKSRIESSQWFEGKWKQSSGSLRFDKNITCHSGHSERESWEGYNVIAVILDEISGFTAESTNSTSQKTAEALYDMYRASVDSRFPDVGKVALLSFPRYKDDYIQRKYKEAIADVEVKIREHTFRIDDEIPWGNEANEFTIEWEEDHIHSYRLPKVYALKRPTWEVNPTRSIEDFRMAFLANATDALSRFACMPPEATDAFFKSREKIERAFSQELLGVNEDGRFADWFIPQEDTIYFAHVDLAQKHDYCAVAMAHVDRWAVTKSFQDTEVAVPYVTVDSIRYWKPAPDKSIDFSDVKDHILDLKRRGFTLKLVTFDRWNSHDIMTELQMYGVNTETLSVAKRHYEDMAILVAEERIKGPNIPLLINEMLRLRIVRDKVDHPRSGSKDLADATTGAVFNAISLTPKNTDLPTVEIRSFYDARKQARDERIESQKKQGVVFDVRMV